MSSKKQREEHAFNSAQECVKNRSWFSVVPSMGFLFFSLGLPLVSQAPQPKPIARSLECPAGDCPLLQGAPQTAGMRSGFVRLMPGASVGWHTTGQNEESLVILHGQGEVLIDAHEKQSFHAPAFAYIPATTVHNVSNTGKDILEYVYVVAPAAKR